MLVQSREYVDSVNLLERVPKGWGRRTSTLSTRGGRPINYHEHSTGGGWVRRCRSQRRDAGKGCAVTLSLQRYPPSLASSFLTRLFLPFCTEGNWIDSLRYHGTGIEVHAGKLWPIKSIRISGPTAIGHLIGELISTPGANAKMRCNKARLHACNYKQLAS